MEQGRPERIARKVVHLWFENETESRGTTVGVRSEKTRLLARASANRSPRLYRRQCPKSSKSQPRIHNLTSQQDTEPEVRDQDEPAEEPAASGCDPNYRPCVPISSADLDCADIGFGVTIVGSDPHSIDGNDNHGLGFESS